MGAKGVASDKTEYGPSWRDVYETWKQAEKTLGDRITLSVQLTRSVHGSPGLRGILYPAGDNVPLAIVGFGPSYAESAKTFPACLYMGLLDAMDEAAKRKAEEGKAEGAERGQ